MISGSKTDHPIPLHAEGQLPLEIAFLAGMLHGKYVVYNRHSIQTHKRRLGTPSHLQAPSQTPEDKHAVYRDYITSRVHQAEAPAVTFSTSNEAVAGF